MLDETTVFIGGSRELSRLNADIRRRIDNIVEKGFRVVIGDANGADKAVQRYLADKHYGKVVVFCMEGRCRNNVGAWPLRRVTATESVRRDFAYYASKDLAMAEEASHGLMLWDGMSRGTLNNVSNLVQRGKPVLLYLTPTKLFRTVRSKRELDELLSTVPGPRSNPTVGSRARTHTMVFRRDLRRGASLFD